MKIIIAGSSGFIGRHLAAFFRQKENELVLLSHQSSEGAHVWNPEKEEIELPLLEGADVVINLAGASIFGRWSRSKKEKIRNSRVVTTRFLCSQLVKLSRLPSLYIGASAVGYYGDCKAEFVDESSRAGSDFLAKVCQEWEASANVLTGKAIRMIFARFGIVLGPDGGILEKVKKPFRAGMGGTIGSGKQIMSWIAIDDLCKAIEHVMAHAEISGPVNFVAPEPVSNDEFTKTLGKILRRPTKLPLPTPLLSLILGEGAEPFLASTHAFPKKLLESGYSFQYSNLDSALKEYLED